MILLNTEVSTSELEQVSVSIAVVNILESLYSAMYLYLHKHNKYLSS